MESAILPQVAAIRAALAGSQGEAAAPAGEFDPAAASASIAKLRALLEANDGDAADAAREVAGALAGKVEAARLAELRSAIDEFDFDGALAKLDAIAGECGLAGGSNG
jgi:hypothetical protein